MRLRGRPDRVDFIDRGHRDVRRVAEVRLAQLPLRDAERRARNRHQFLRDRLRPAEEVAGRPRRSPAGEISSMMPISFASSASIVLPKYTIGWSCGFGTA